MAKAIRRLPQAARQRVIEGIKALAQDPSPRGCEKLKKPFYRIRVGDYRIVYSVWDDQQVVEIDKMARRSETTYKPYQ
ncbi:MAG: type II toxin-antitoxin system RelE/ParE family toxin [Anaerolineae bacterium]